MCIKFVNELLLNPSLDFEVFKKDAMHRSPVRQLLFPGAQIPKNDFSRRGTDFGLQLQGV